MRRHDSGAGCGARACVSHTQVREAPGHRPPQLRGAAHQELDEGRMNAGQSLRDRGEGYPSPSGPGSHGPGNQKPPLRSAERRARLRKTRPTPQAWTIRAPFGAPLPHLQ